ncbi:MAG: signal peptidase I [Acidobacteriota bacterium]|nr:signal peptidase I [Acidobacteriota bacterium]MDH3522245.1 signal peptidase I [Acidobacteriota bacterium]
MSAKKTSNVRETLEALLIAGAFLGFSNTFVVKTFYIPSASMETTLLVGDHLFVNRFIYGDAATSVERALLPSRDLRRGDIVIFRSPEDPKLDMVKRCIGLPGDVIEIDTKDLYVNGEWVEDSSYTRHSDPRINPRRDDFGPLTVPEDHYFCMGDNRDNSKDSRYWGTVPARFIKGRAFLIYWSYGGETSDGVWRSWGHRLKLLARTVLGFFVQSRWERTFTIVR